jgi:hypothetical protein
MSAGLPGLGLGGLFFIISALIAPFIEVGRIAIGRRREVDWPGVWRQFAQALTMIAAVDLTLRAIYGFSRLMGLGDTPRLDVITVIPLIPVAITACLLAAVLLTAKAVDLATPVLRDMPRISSALPARNRVIALTAVVGAIWFALLFSGANELTRLPGRDAGNERSPARPDLADASRAKDMVAATGPRSDATDVETTDASSEPLPSAAASGSTAEPEPSGGGNGGAGVAGPAVPAVSAPAGGGATAAPADAVAPAPPPASNAPETGGSPAAPPAPEPAEPPAAPSPPADSGPPAEAGPPEHAGPPAHSNAPPGAGPG